MHCLTVSVRQKSEHNFIGSFAQDLRRMKQNWLPCHIPPKHKWLLVEFSSLGLYTEVPFPLAVNWRLLPALEDLAFAQALSLGSLQFQGQQENIADLHEGPSLSFTGLPLIRSNPYRLVSFELSQRQAIRAFIASVKIHWSHNVK